MVVDMIAKMTNVTTRKSISELTDSRALIKNQKSTFGSSTIISVSKGATMGDFGDFQW